MKFRELMTRNLSDLEKACSKHGLQPNLPRTKRFDLEKLLCLEAEIFTYPFSLIHYAAAVCDKNALVHCLERGDDPNKQDQHGFTAAHYAAAYGFASTMIEILVSKGANLSLRSHGDVTVQECALSSTFNKENTCYYLEQVGVSRDDFLSFPVSNASIRFNILKWLDLVDLQNVARVSRAHGGYVKTFFKSHIKTVRFPKEVLSETPDQARLLDYGLRLAVDRQYPAMTAAYLASGAIFINENNSLPDDPTCLTIMLNDLIQDGKKGVAKALFNGLFEKLTLEDHATYLLVQGTDAEITRYMASQPNKWPDCLLHMWGQSTHFNKYQERHHYIWDNLLTENHKRMAVFFVLLMMLGEKERSNLESRKMSFFSRQWKIKYKRRADLLIINLGQKFNEDEFVAKIPAMVSSINQLSKNIRKKIIVNSIGDHNIRVFRPILQMVNCDDIKFSLVDIFKSYNCYLKRGEVFSNIEFVTTNYQNLITDDTASHIVKLMAGDTGNDPAAIDDVKNHLKEADMSKSLLVFLVRYFAYKGSNDLISFLIDEYEAEFPFLFKEYSKYSGEPSGLFQWNRIRCQI